MGGPRRFLGLFVADRPTEHDVLANGAVEETRLLLHYADQLQTYSSTVHRPIGSSSLPVECSRYLSDVAGADRTNVLAVE